MNASSAGQRGFARTVAILIVVAFSLALSACGPTRLAQSDPLIIAAPALEQNALLYVAEAQQLFERHGLQITIQDQETGVAAMDALLNGQADIAQLAEFPFIRPAMEGHPVQIIAVNDRFENDYLLVRKDRGIAGEADLRGKKIGVIRGTILEFYLGRFLDLHGIALDDVSVVDTVDTSQTTGAVVNGELDAVVAFQPHVDSIQSRLGDAVVTWPVQNNQLVYGILVANTDWLSQNGDSVERFLRALADAEDLVAAQPDVARAIVRDRLELDGNYVARVWPLHRFSLSLDFSLVVAMNDEARWMIDHGLIRGTIPDFKEYIYLDGLAAVEPEAVHIRR